MADDKRKTKAQLIAELEEMRQQRTVEKACERIREEVLTMRQSEDMVKVIAVMWQEMVNLGIQTPAASIGFVDEDADRGISYAAIENPRKYGISWTGTRVEEINEDTVVLHQTENKESPLGHSWRQRKVESFTQEINESGLRGLGELFGFDRPFLPYWIGEWIVTNVPFQHGAVGFRERKYFEDHVTIVQELTEGLSLGYLRFLDFQRIEEKNQALEKANRQIEENTRRKSDFLARMSHDLRTPMNAIIGYTRILLRKAQEKLEPRQLRNLENIDTSAHNLLNLINEILDLSRVEAGRIEVKPQDVDLKELAVDCVAAIEPLIQAEVQLIQEIETVPSLRTDREILRKVLMNLLGNAVKFTDAGSITVSVQPVDDQVEISIADTGMGIPPEDLPDIFEEFRQVERQGSTEKEGTGLGLAIAKKSVELLGGTISTESEVGKGTTFTLRIKDYPSE
jgi:signal transduction histidine kinase